MPHADEARDPAPRDRSWRHHHNPGRSPHSVGDVDQGLAVDEHVVRRRHASVIVDAERDGLVDPLVPGRSRDLLAQLGHRRTLTVVRRVFPIRPSLATTMTRIAPGREPPDGAGRSRRASTERSKLPAQRGAVVPWTDRPERRCRRQLAPATWAVFHVKRRTWLFHVTPTPCRSNSTTCDIPRLSEAPSSVENSSAPVAYAAHVACRSPVRLISPLICTPVAHNAAASTRGQGQPIRDG